MPRKLANSSESSKQARQFSTSTVLRNVTARHFLTPTPPKKIHAFESLPTSWEEKIKI